MATRLTFLGVMVTAVAIGGGWGALADGDAGTGEGAKIVVTAHGEVTRSADEMERMGGLLAEAQRWIAAHRALPGVEERGQVREMLVQAADLATKIEHDRIVSLLARFEILKAQLEIEDFKGARATVDSANWTEDFQREWRDKVAAAEKGRKSDGRSAGMQREKNAE